MDVMDCFILISNRRNICPLTISGGTHLRADIHGKDQIRGTAGRAEQQVVSQGPHASCAASLRPSCHAVADGEQRHGTDQKLDRLQHGSSESSREEGKSRRGQDN
jgi:hypothetical protein